MSGLLARAAAANAMIHPFGRMPQETAHMHAFSAQISQLGQGHMPSDPAPPSWMQPASDRQNGQARKSLHFPTSSLPSVSMPIPTVPRINPLRADAGSMQTANMQSQFQTTQPAMSLAPRQPANSVPFNSPMPPSYQTAMPAKARTPGASPQGLISNSLARPQGLATGSLAPTTGLVTSSLAKSATAPQMQGTVPDSFVPYILERGKSASASSS